MQVSIQVDNTPFSQEFKDVSQFNCCKVHIIPYSLLIFLMHLELSSALGFTLTLLNLLTWTITCGDHTAHQAVLNHYYTKLLSQQL